MLSENKENVNNFPFQNQDFPIKSPSSKLDDKSTPKKRKVNSSQELEKISFTDVNKTNNQETPSRKNILSDITTPSPLKKANTAGKESPRVTNKQVKFNNVPTLKIFEQESNESIIEPKCLNKSSIKFSLEDHSPISIKEHFYRYNPSTSSQASKNISDYEEKFNIINENISKLEKDVSRIIKNKQDLDNSKNSQPSYDNLKQNNSTSNESRNSCKTDFNIFLDQQDKPLDEYETNRQKVCNSVMKILYKGLRDPYKPEILAPLGDQSGHKMLLNKKYDQKDGKLSDISSPIIALSNLSLFQNKMTSWKDKYSKKSDD